MIDQFLIIRTPVADPEGGSVGGGGWSNPPLNPNYFIFMGNFKKSWVN